MPPLPLISYPAIGDQLQPQTVTKEKPVTLSAGDYGALIVQRGGKVVLPGGNYTFSSVILSDSSSLVAAKGLVKVAIRGRLIVGTSVTIGPVRSNNKTAPAGFLEILVNGQDEDEGPKAVVTTAQKDAASIGDKSSITALVVVPRGTLWLGNAVTATGAFMAFDIAIQNKVMAIFQDSVPDNAVGQQGVQRLKGYVPLPTSQAAALMLPVHPDRTIELSISLPAR